MSAILSRALTGSRTGLLVVLALLVALFAVGAFVSDRFATTGNILNVYEQSTGLALVSLGQTLTVLTGGIDLSVGSVVSLLSMLTSGLIDGRAEMVVPVLAGVLALGTLIGALNGGLIVATGVHPLIVTLGTGAIVQGIALLYGLGPVGGVPLEFDVFAYGTFAGGLSIGATIALTLFLLVSFFLNNTRTGRRIYAVGDDAHAADLMGLPRRRILVGVYAASGFFAALTAIYLVSRFSAGQPYTGANYTLASITPVVVGGTMLTGGRGGVIGTLLGVYLVSLLNNMLNFLDISSHYQLVVQGLVIILAVSVYVEKQRGLA
ncbi:ABC transporter permease [Aureimonas phyllosphaerae]|uniref:Ribose transport system permease protein n=1 Tax=Aureimonas phyllosphaerae TaxID=1166078 RepID=A0A7W6BZT3_9HYPH|nr:ABC transporter permease [Aureimonas phyllosphaerae]MBB3937780.1 ribose transport system permease protein [Aureimonas phyllosphaerae]MBB3961685.1 ribose transport system permease protein [Aureimonas phyllosphaerae]SFF45873.1 monosaccharide ABC transporter membrane protein, CUT2 family [Aureimonas phyllosphaerae]